MTLRSFPRLPTFFSLLIATAPLGLSAQGTALLASGTAVVNTYPKDAALQYLAPAGEIRQGEVIAVLDSTPLTNALRELTRRVNDLEAQHHVAVDKLEVTEAINREKLTTAQEALTSAERALTKYLENEAPGAEVALKLTLHDAETEFKKQTERYNTRDRLLQEGFIQKVEYDNEETRLKRTELALEAARLKMDAFLKYEREERESQLAKETKKLKEELAQIERSTAAALVTAREAVEISQERLETARTERDRLTRELEKTIIRASKQGRFTPTKASASTESTTDSTADSTAETTDKAAPPFTRGDEIATGTILGYIKGD